MKTPLIIIITIFLFITQILFSLYYSGKIVLINSSYNQNQVQISDLKLKIQQQKVNLAQYQNPQFLIKQAPNLVPIVNGYYE